jgi:hypothetical protein
MAVLLHSRCFDTAMPAAFAFNPHPPSCFIQKMFRSFWLTHPEEVLEQLQRARVAAARFHMPPSSGAAAGSGGGASLSMEGGLVTKLVVECDPKEQESACRFSVSNPHQHLMYVTSKCAQ